MNATTTGQLDLASIYLARAEQLLREARRMKLYQLLGLGDYTQQVTRQTMWAREFNIVSIRERRKAQETRV